MKEAESEVSSQSQSVNHGNGFKSILGAKFTRLTVIAFSGRNYSRQAKWECLCECGAACIVVGSKLRSGRTRSCGCLSREMTGKRATVHGWTKHPLYRMWKEMMNRCNNPNIKHYSNYGGRGIAVCERWQASFDNFLLDMEERPTPNHSIERKNNNGNYEPGNCVWATAVEQGANKRTNLVLTFEGRTQTMTQWAREKNIKPSTIQARLSRYGWPLGRTLNTPLLRKKAAEPFGSAAH